MRVVALLAASSSAYGGLMAPSYYVESCANYYAGCPSGPNLVRPSGSTVDYGALWTTYWNNHGGGFPGVYNVTANAIDSANGWVVGWIFGDPQLRTGFIYNPDLGEVVCCSTDDPWRLTSITEDGYILWQGGMGVSHTSLLTGPIGGSPPNLLSTATFVSGTFNEHDLAVMFLGGNLFERDSSGRFFGTSVVLIPIPEPTTLPLMALVVGGALAVVRRKQRNLRH